MKINNAKIELHINKLAGNKYHGFIMPKGAIYGTDNKGVFVCTSYKLYAEYMTANGIKYKPLDCRIAGYKPTLKIYRPERNFSALMNGGSPTRHDNWVKHYECSETVAQICQLHKTQPHATRINYRTNDKDKVRFKQQGENSSLQAYSVPKISGNEAKAVAKMLNLPKYSKASCVI